jgi:hypothetical protein
VEDRKMASPAETVIALSTKRIISSKITGQDYEVRIYLPHSSPNHPDQNYPVLYVMEWNESLWEAGQRESLNVGLETGGDSQEGIPGAVNGDKVEGGYYRTIEGTKYSDFR